MANASLSAVARTERGKGAARSLRREGQIPAVIYGHAREPQSLALNARDLGRLLEHVTGSTIIELTIDGKASRTLVREIQRHPFKRHVMHIDFQELVAGEKVTVDVPIIYRGTPAGVREGGILDQVMHAITISADPVHIPDHIDIDVSALVIGHALHISDLTLPASIEVLDEPTATVCMVTAPKVEAAPVADEPTAAEPELIRKAKPDDEA
ncbi:MAG: 50S ribosomal protein L25/general stress protein Ctc [Gemmatimonadaceae bacterium]|nr:50S ribosomal protein L25/general stress protein Ctc [Gemmatimonadaceae bacterium]